MKPLGFQVAINMAGALGIEVETLTFPPYNLWDV